MIKYTKWQFLIDCHTLLDSANGRVTDSNIFCPFLSVHVGFLSVPHAVNAVSGDIRFVRSYPLASFGHVQNFEQTPPDKYVQWMNVTCALVCGLSGSHAFGIL